jgi:hypothetical protein
VLLLLVEVQGGVGVRAQGEIHGYLSTAKRVYEHMKNGSNGGAFQAARNASE